MIEYKKFPDPFRLEFKAYIREVRIPQQGHGHGHNIYANPDAFDCSSRSIEQHTFPLEAAEIVPLNTIYNISQLEAADIGGMPNEYITSLAIRPIVAMGLFDMEYAGNRPLQMWAMCITSEEGLLPQQIQDPKYGSIVCKRLGFFAVGNMPTFYSKGSLKKIAPLEYRVIEEKLPVETVVLI